jgi:SAM-dependent methyltransferase
MRAGKVRYSRRTRAINWEQVDPDFPPPGNALFLLADIHDPPFKMESFDFIAGLNLIDSVKRPLTALGQMDAMLKPGGRLLLSAPYVWDAEVSEEWLETEKDDGHAFLKLLLTGAMLPGCGFDYQITLEMTGMPWRLRRQDTQQFLYLVDTIVAKKADAIECRAASPLEDLA